MIKTEKNTLLEKLEYLTERNAHTIARLEIAKRFEYCKQFENILNHINAIHEIVGSMPYNLVNYRNSITDKMLNAIEKHEGKELVQEIYNHL